MSSNFYFIMYVKQGLLACTGSLSFGHLQPFKASFYTFHTDHPRQLFDRNCTWLVLDFFICIDWTFLVLDDRVISRVV